jgi:C_GCAxxG_C_C family probable redox protein
MSEQAPQRSLELFKSGFFCAESVLLAIAESQGIQSDLIPRIATGFCSGISRTGGMCGAVSGGIMGIGLVVGRDSPAESLEPAYALTQKLISRFEGQYGSVNCRQLIGCDLSTPRQDKGISWKITSWNVVCNVLRMQQAWRFHLLTSCILQGPADRRSGDGWR